MMLRTVLKADVVMLQTRDSINFFAGLLGARVYWLPYGPLRYLRNHWIFIDLPEGGCEIDFYVEFEFKSKLLQKLIGALFHEAVSRMVRSFEARAKDLYGTPVGQAIAPNPA